MSLLQAYIAASGTKQSALAEALGVSRGYLSELVGGTKKPSLELAFAIQRATEGAVPASSWVEAPELERSVVHSSDDVLPVTERGAA